MTMNHTISATDLAIMWHDYFLRKRNQVSSVFRKRFFLMILNRITDPVRNWWQALENFGDGFKRRMMMSSGFHHNMTEERNLELGSESIKNSL